MLIREGLIISICIMAIGNCNLWDNIFSQAEASSPILFCQPLNFRYLFKYHGIEFQTEVDYNNQLSLITVSIARYLVFSSIEVIKIQIDLNNYLIVINSILRGCQKYHLVGARWGNIKKMHIKQRLFLINILFSYIGRNQRDKTMNKYKLMPNIFQKQKQANQNLLYQQNNYNNIVVIVNQKDFQKDKQIRFKLKSNTSRKYECSGEIKDITKQTIYQIIQTTLLSSQYQKNMQLNKLSNGV